jgi:hypothetical protein
MYLSLGPCKFNLNFSGMTFTQQPKLDTTLTATGDNDIVSRKMISGLLPKTEVFNSSNYIQIGCKISKGKKGAVVIRRNSIANGVESIVIGDVIQLVGNNSISIMSLTPSDRATTPAMTVTEANSFFIGNMGVNKVTFGTIGLEFTWDVDSVKLKVGNKFIIFNLS